MGIIELRKKAGGGKMKRYFKGGLVVLFLLFVLLGTVTIHTIIQAQSYGKLVNYVGIVRGASQKLVKLELAHEPNDELINYLDEILEELLTGNGPYDLPLVKDGDYRLDLENLNDMWTRMKESIMEFRQGTIDGNELLELSEDYFTQANETVFSADRYSSAQIHMLSSICIGMFATMLLVWGLLFLALSRKVTFLESENKQLSDLTHRDPLTGIYQYESFKEKAQLLLDNAGNKNMLWSIRILQISNISMMYLGTPMVTASFPVTEKFCAPACRRTRSAAGLPPIILCFSSITVIKKR